jgi:DNA-binding transcriptional LysR family regulator
MDTSKLSIFIAAADTGSLSRAARQLGMQLSTVSRQLADLEDALGVELLVRTGRGVRVTAAGERYLERARHIVREVEAAAAEVRGDQGAALTQLRLSAPVEVSLRLLPTVLAELACRHPTLPIDLHSEARRVSLLEEEYDAAIRLGSLKESYLVARRLGAISLVLCASPEAAQGVRSASDLSSREFALVAGTRTELSGSLRGRPVQLQLKGACRVSTFTEAAALAACSSRLVLLPSFTAAEFLASRKLVRVWPGLSFPQVDLHLVHTQRHRGSAIMRDLGDLLAEALEHAERLATQDPYPRGA